MKLLYYLAIFTLLGIMASVFSCTKDTEEYVPDNKAPVARAGVDQVIILPKDSAVLNGSFSSDPDGRIVKYQWTKKAGPSSFVIDNVNSGITMVRSLVRGVYQFELSVQDEFGAWGKDIVDITVQTADGSNISPVAQAGEDQSIGFPTNFVELNGRNSYDPDGAIISYLWTKIDGPASYIILTPNEALTTVTDLEVGRYEFELKVTDNKGLVDKDTVAVLIYTGSNCSVMVPQVNVTVTEIGTLSDARSPYAAAAGDKIVFAGGFPFTDVVDVYDVSDKSWSTHHLSQKRWNMAVVSCGNKIFFAGGNDESDSYDIVDIYDVYDGSWQVIHLREPKMNMGTAVIGDKVFFAGGITDGGWGQTDIVEIYDISENSWTLSLLSKARHGASGVTAGNKVYFAGGFDWLDGNRPLNNVDIFDESGYGTTASLNILAGGVSGAASGDYIYWGGVDGRQADGKAEIWNIANSTVTMSCLSFPRYYPTAIQRNDDIVFFTPGPGFINFNATHSNQIDVYNISTGTRYLGYLNQPVCGAGVVSYNNTIYMGGGKIGSQNYTDKVYRISW